MYLLGLQELQPEVQGICGPVWVIMRHHYVQFLGAWPKENQWKIPFAVGRKDHVWGLQAACGIFCYLACQTKYGKKRDRLDSSTRLKESCHKCRMAKSYQLTFAKVEKRCCRNLLCFCSLTQEHQQQPKPPLKAPTPRPHLLWK